jgi:hypothetical protein
MEMKGNGREVRSYSIVKCEEKKRGGVPVTMVNIREAPLLQLNNFLVARELGQRPNGLGCGKGTGWWA